MIIKEFSLEPMTCIVKDIVYSARQDSPTPKEIRMANRLFSEFKIPIIFLPERNIPGIKNPDVLMGKTFVEFKFLTGSINSVGVHFRKATKQASYVCLWIENSEITLERVKNKINGERKHLMSKGLWKDRKPKGVFIIINNKFYSLELQT